MKNQENGEKEKILTINGKNYTPEVEEDRKQQLLKVRAELETQFKSGEIDSVEYNRRVVELEIPDEYKNQHRIPRKKRRRILIALLLLVVLSAIPGAVYVGFRYYFQNTLLAKDIELELSDKPEDAKETLDPGEEIENEEITDFDEPTEPDTIDEHEKPTKLDESSLESGPVQIKTKKEAGGGYKKENGEYKNRPISIVYKDYYDITGIVTSVHDFWGFDDYDMLIPRDVCLTWGSLAETFLRGGAHFYQSYRVCYGKASDEAGEAVETFMFKTPFGQTRSSLSFMSNNHLIASTSEIRDQILGMKNKDEVRIKGYLVDVTYGKLSLKSSEERKDIGNGACEVIYVTEIENRGQRTKK